MADLLLVGGGDDERRVLDALPGLRVIDETGLAAALDDPVDVVVVGRRAEQQLALVQQAHAAQPDAGIVVVVPDDAPGHVRRAFTYAPGLPTDLQVVTTVEGMADLVRSEAANSRLKRGHRQLMVALARDPQASRIGTGTAPTRLAPMGTLLDHAPLGVLVTNSDGALVAWNARAAQLVGIGTDAAGHSLAALLTDPAGVTAALHRVVTGDDPGAALGVGVRGRSETALELSAALTQLDDGTPAVLVLLLDVTVRRAAERTRDELSDRLGVVQRSQAFLLQAFDVLAEAFGYAETLERLAAVSVPTLGDLCLIDVVDETGQLQRMAARHADQARQPLADMLRHRYSPDVHGEHPGAAAVANRETRWAPEVSSDFLRRTSRNEAHYRLITELGFSGYMTVPLVANDKVLGCVTLVSTGSGRRFGPPDVALAEELAGRVAKVVAKARRYDREHRIAETLQRSMLAEVPDLAPVQVAARYVPAREDTQVGGDWYDAFVLPDGVPALIIGDVVGHDLEAATRMGQLRNILRGLAWDRTDGPSEVLARLDELNEALQITDLASLLYGLLERSPAGGYLLRWVNAGHLPPALVEADGTTHLLDDSLDVILGAPGPVRRREATRTLPAGSTLLFYTDGLVESRADQLERGLPLLLERLAGLATAPLDRLCDQVLAGLAADLGAPPDDDVALLAVRVP